MLLKKSYISLFALLTVSLLSIAQQLYINSVTQQAQRQSIHPTGYHNDDPCSDNVLYAAAEDLKNNKITRIEFDAIVDTHNIYKKKNCENDEKSEGDNQCANRLKPGKIKGDQKICGPGSLVAELSSVQLASGEASEALTYAWEKRVKGSKQWWPVIGANKPSHQPYNLRNTTEFRRIVQGKVCPPVTSNIVTVKVGKTAVAAITAPDSVKVNQAADFSSLKSGFFGLADGHSYKWQFQGGQPAQSSVRTPSVTWSSGGHKQVTLQVERKGCISTDTVIVFVIGPPPKKEEEEDPIPPLPDTTSVRLDTIQPIPPLPPRDSTIAEETPNEVETYENLTKNTSGGPYLECPKRDLVYDIEGSSVSIYIQKTEQKGKICIVIKDDELVMAHKIAKVDVELQAHDTTLMYGMINALITNEKGQEYIPFNYKENKLHKWKNEEYECGYNSIQIPPPNFKCSNPEHTKPTYNTCGNLRKEIDRLKGLGSGECEFIALFPSRTSEKVFLLRQNNVTEIEGLDASLFRFPNPQLSFPKGWNKKQQANAIGRLLEKLAIFLGYDEDLKIIQTPNDGNGLYFTVLGNGTHGKYLFSFGYNNRGQYVEYTPVQLIAGAALSQTVTQLLWQKNAKQLTRFIADWQSTGNRALVEAILPSSASVNPLVTLGNPTESDLLPPHILSSIQDKKPLDLLIYDSENYQVQRANSDKEKTWLGRQLNKHNNTWLYYLAIADPHLIVISEDFAKSTFVFLFKNSNSALWAWHGKGSKPPKQMRLLQGNQNFVLQEQRVSAYIKYLNKATVEDKDFWLEEAINDRKLIPLDLFYQ